MVKMVKECSILPSYSMFTSISYNNLKSLPPPPSYTEVNHTTPEPFRYKENLNNYDLKNNLQNLNIETMLQCSVSLMNEKKEYEQGDTIKVKLKFSTLLNGKVKYSYVYIYLEGVMVLNCKVERTFLMMLDYDSFLSASNTIERGITETRLFQFRLPFSLLDSQCRKYHVDSHLRLPPSSNNKLNYGQNLKISYKISCFIIHDNLIIGSCELPIRFIPKTVSGNCNSVTYFDLIEQFKQDLIYVNKSKFDTIYQRLLSLLKCEESLDFKIQQSKLILEYVPLGNTDINQIIQFEYQASSVRSISGELVVINGNSTRSIPIHLTPKLFYNENQSKYHQIISDTIKNTLQLLPNDSSIKKSGSLKDLKKLLMINVSYTNLTIPKITFTNTHIFLHLKKMSIQNLDNANLQNRYGIGFNLTPNYQNCHAFREYYIHLNITTRTKKVSINIPLEVVKS